MTTRTVFPMSFFGNRSMQNLIGDNAPNPLQLVRLQIEQQVNGSFPLIHQVATTMTFKNTHHAVIEGALEFTLPNTATVCGYGLDIDGVIVDGVVVEKQAARIAFEKEVRKGIDPGFVELVTGNVFRTRVYPIRPQQTRIVRVIYQDQATPMPNTNSLIFHIPIQFSKKLDSLDIVVSCVGHTKIKPTFLIDASTDSNSYPDFIDSGTGRLTAEWHLTNVDPPPTNSRTISYTLPESLTPMMSAVELDTTVGAYFAISLALPTSQQSHVSFSKSICILWDASLSRSNSAANRTLELNALKIVLDSWISQYGQVTVIVIIFRNDMEEPKHFQLRSDSWSEFVKLLNDIPYDGATNLAQLASIRLTQPMTHYFLFSDCISTIGDDVTIDNRFSALAAPVWIFNGNPIQEPIDQGFIRYLTQRSEGGGYFNRDQLEQTSSNKLASIIDTIQMKYVATASKVSIQQVYPSHGISISANTERFLLVGQLATPLPTSAQLELEFTVNNQTCRLPVSFDVPLPTLNIVSGIGLIRRLWAQQKLAELSAFKDKNRADIIALGTQYSLVSDFTSLMVLETLHQHLQYHICPAKSRKQLYDEYMQRQKQETTKKQNKFPQLLNTWNQNCQWYDQVITEADRHRAFLPKTTVTIKPASSLFGFGGGFPQAQTYAPFTFGPSTTAPMASNAGPFLGFGAPTASPMGSNPGPFSGFGAPTTSPMASNADLFSLFDASTYASPEVNTRMSAASVAPSMASSTTSFSASSFPGSMQNAPQASSTTSDTPVTIVLHDSNPQSSCITRLRSAGNMTSAYSIYLNERSSNRQSPSFYFDSASFFFSPTFTSLSTTSVLDAFNQQPNLLILSKLMTNNSKSLEYGIRILTNMLELELEAPQLLRSVAYKLMELNRWDLAVGVCRKIYSLRPDEPHSLRDLALVLIELGQHKQALDLLKQIIVDVWDSQYTSIEIIVLHDFNRFLLSLNNDNSIAQIDRRFIRHLPCDIRIVLEWDTPDTSVELSVTEPTGQVCSQYSGSRTDIGGYLFGLPNFRQSNGLWEYMLRTAINGSYTIHAKYTYNSRQTTTGTITALIYIYKHYGLINEEKQIRTVRLTNLQESIEVGRIEFGDSTVTTLKTELQAMQDECRRLQDRLIGSKQTSQSTTRHENVSCDACGIVPIVGERYKCLLCPNLDLCEVCQMSSTSLGHMHDVKHPLLCIHDSTHYPSSIYFLNRSEIRHLNIRCASCSASPIVGIRYSCATCKIDLCEQCEFLGTHDSRHKLLKIIYPQSDSIV